MSGPHDAGESELTGSPSHGFGDLVPDADGGIIARSEFTLDDDDLRALIRHFLIRRRGFHVQIAAFSLFIVFGLVLLATHGHDAVVYFGLGVVGMFVLSVQPRQVARQISSNPLLREHRSYVFSDAGVCIESASQSSKTTWNLYDHFVTWKDAYGLKPVSSPAYIYLPKRGFLSSDDEENFKELLRRHVKQHPSAVFPKGVGLPRTQPR